MSAAVTLLGNAFSALHQQHSRNLIGGPAAAARNIISGNGQAAFSMTAAFAPTTSSRAILIGLDISAAPLSNNFSGVTISGAAMEIGSAAAWRAQQRDFRQRPEWHQPGRSPRNLNVVQGNLIGTDVTGANRLGNFICRRAHRIGIQSVVGGTHLLERNVISANLQSGVFCLGPALQTTSSSGNFIGTNIVGNAGPWEILLRHRHLGRGRNQIGGPNWRREPHLQPNSTAASISKTPARLPMSSRKLYRPQMSLWHRFGQCYCRHFHLRHQRHPHRGTVSGAGNLISEIQMSPSPSVIPAPTPPLSRETTSAPKANGTTALGNQWHNIELPQQRRQ